MFDNQRHLRVPFVFGGCRARWGRAAALEQPEALAGEISAFFGGLDEP
ncbi:MAG: hypothetical protein LH480_01540 [Rubrivivax sp.]|nr:hypothetical protein [Rubrivivax sp.]